MDNLEKNNPNWHEGNDVLDEYAPPLAIDNYLVKLPNGSRKQMTAAEYYEEYFDAHGRPLGDLPPYELAGSPSSDGLASPMETSADMTMQSMLGTTAIRLIPGTHDAWLEHMEQIAGQPLATPINRSPIIVDRRTGCDILYPKTSLPTTNEVLA